MLIFVSMVVFAKIFSKLMSYEFMINDYKLGIIINGVEKSVLSRY